MATRNNNAVSRRIFILPIRSVVLPVRIQHPNMLPNLKIIESFCQRNPLYQVANSPTAMLPHKRVGVVHDNHRTHKHTRENGHKRRGAFEAEIGEQSERDVLRTERREIPRGREHIRIAPLLKKNLKRNAKKKSVKEKTTL